jgi:hypothetical protein
MWLDGAAEVPMRTLELLVGILAGGTLGSCGGGAANSSLLGSGVGGGDTSDGAGPGGAAPSVVLDGKITAGPWAGFGFTATDPGAATITPDCSGGTGCVPPFVGSTFCMRGTVTGRQDFTGFAMLGWNVNQEAGGPANTWAVPATGGVTVRVLNNPPNTALRVQLQGTNPHDGADRWCAALDNGQLVPWSSFKTNCWQGGSPQNPLIAGTPIQQGSILVPGLLTDLPFDVCLLDIEIQP